MTYLVDTSAWLDYLQGRETAASLAVTEILDTGVPFGISSMIYQELLQGAASEKDFEALADYFGTQRFYRLQDPKASHREAAYLYFRCRREGVTVRSTIDCLIARLAIENELELLHNDRDFSNIGRVVPELHLV